MAAALGDVAAGSAGKGGGEAASGGSAAAGQAISSMFNAAASMYSSEMAAKTAADSANLQGLSAGVNATMATEAQYDSLRQAFNKDVASKLQATEKSTEEDKKLLLQDKQTEAAQKLDWNKSQLLAQTEMEKRLKELEVQRTLGTLQQATAYDLGAMNANNQQMQTVGELALKRMHQASAAEEAEKAGRRGFILSLGDLQERQRHGKAIDQLAVSNEENNDWLRRAQFGLQSWEVADRSADNKTRLHVDLQAKRGEIFDNHYDHEVNRNMIMLKGSMEHQQAFWNEMYRQKAASVAWSGELSRLHSELQQKEEDLRHVSRLNRVYENEAEEKASWEKKERGFREKLINRAARRFAPY